MLSLIKKYYLFGLMLALFCFALRTCYLQHEVTFLEHENANLGAQLQDSSNKLAILQDAGAKAAQREAVIRENENERIKLFKNATIVTASVPEARRIMDDQTRISLIRRLNRPL